MKTKLILFAFIFGMLFAACKKEKKSLNDFMIGNWQTEYIKIEMPTVNKTDSTSVFEDDFSKPNVGRAQSTDEGFTGKVIYDWDNDGEFDDTLIMKTKRLE